ncbi:hypothetical protein [Acrocarpospora catenulata]|uniref:hypothetical protein n=1 Tax=Acrocarpospora catenulata TaxID=2836182 RepID=UPI001BDAE34B|nr:hypothetical protein [Acrocarpospora catenulata]
MRKILALVAAALLAFGVFGGALAAAAPAEPAKAYGGCVSKSTGYLRVLERNNLAKSTVGACKSTERKITFPSRTGLIKGDRGASAYEVWRDTKLADGTQPNKAKTEADYLASLKGATGPAGPKGDGGPAGPAPVKLVLKYGGKTVNCTKDAAATDLTYECADAPTS